MAATVCVSNLTKINSYQVYKTFLPSNLISSIVSTWAVAGWARWTSHGHMLFYLYEYCYSLLAVIVTNVGEILQMEIFQITFKLPPLWPMLFVMESCPYFVLKSFCFSMFSVYLNWIDNGIQTDTVFEYLQEFPILSSLIIFTRSMSRYYQNEGSRVTGSSLTSPLWYPV